MKGFNCSVCQEFNRFTKLEMEMLERYKGVPFLEVCKDCAMTKSREEMVKIIVDREPESSKKIKE